MQMRNYYATLEVNENATSADIRFAYKKLVFQHPDKHMNDQKNAGQKFSDIHEAYEVLSNSNKRVKYDAERKSNTLSLLTSQQSSAGFFSPSLTLMVEALYKQNPDQLVTADFNNEKSEYMIISLLGLEPVDAESFKNRISKIIDMLGEGWVRPSTNNNFQIDIGFDNPQKTKYFMEVIEKTVEEAFIDSIESAKEFLRNIR